MDIIKSRRLLKFDASKIYEQLGFAVKANQASKASLVALRTLLLGMEDEDQFVIKALVGRIEGLENEITEIEKLATKLRARSEHQKLSYLTKISESLRLTLHWFSAFVKTHNLEEQEQLAPILRSVQQSATGIDLLTKRSIANSVRLETTQDLVRKEHRKELSESKAVLDIDPGDVVFQEPITSMQKMVNAIRQEMKSSGKL
jgi:hypothetical protein